MMAAMHQDAARWDARHRTSAPGVARPPDVLVDRPELLALIPRSGTALDIACGTGAQSLWLAARGLSVTALDVSPVAVDLTNTAAARAGLDTVDAIAIDLDGGLPHRPSPVDVIVCQRFRQPDLYGPMIDRLRPGGIAVVTVLSEVDMDTSAGPFHAPAGELRSAFTRDDTEIVLDVEAEGTASVVVIKRR